MAETEEHHLVTKAWQREFADDRKRLAVIDVATGTWSITPTKRNWVLPDFNAFVERSGETCRDLEREWGKIEAPTLRRIRGVAPTVRGDEHRGAVIQLFAMHLVRSEAFREAHLEIANGYRDRHLEGYETHPEARAAWVREFGREAEPGELHRYALDRYDENAAANRLFVDSMVGQYNKLAERLSRYHLQVITVGAHVGGFILGDVPVVHACSKTGRHGFRDRLALGDSNVIVGPLSRHTAVALSARSVANIHIRARRKLDLVNAVFWRAAMREVACHPDDLAVARKLRHTHGSLPLAELMPAG